jgi:hypothetical protein
MVGVSQLWKIRLKKGPQMSSLQRRIAVVIDTTANLVTQLRELDLLREQVRKAEELYHLAKQELRDADKSSPLSIREGAQRMKGELFIRYYNVSPNSISRVQGPGVRAC